MLIGVCQMSSPRSQVQYEVKILKQISHLPVVFMLRHLNGQVTKISISSNNYANCTKYVSISGLTFNGCFKYDGNQLDETRGIYYTPDPPIISVYRENKITRHLENIKNIILKEIELLKFSSKKLLISYSNYKIEVYDYFIKGQLYQFNPIYNQGNLEVYEVPPPPDELDLAFDDCSGLTIYDHEIEFSSPTLVKGLFSTPGITYLIHLQNTTTISTKSADHRPDTIMLNPDRYYLITHPQKLTKREKA